MAMQTDEAGPWDEEDRDRRVRLLEATGMARAARAPLDVSELAGELAVSETTIRIELGSYRLSG